MIDCNLKNGVLIVLALMASTAVLIVGIKSVGERIDALDNAEKLSRSASVERVEVHKKPQRTIKLGQTFRLFAGVFTAVDYIEATDEFTLMGVNSSGELSSTSISSNALIYLVFGEKAD